MRRCLQQIRCELVGWLLAILASAVYLLTLEPSVSFWDCGEFISTNLLLGIGHPPGAPTYQLLAHLFTLFSGAAVQAAWWSNALSAVAGGVTVAFLYWSLLLLFEDFGREGVPASRGRICVASAVGALCYLFCDTAWFSAVESEVYGLAMLFASAMVWCMLRWQREADSPHGARWLLLAALLTGLSAGVHLLCLLALPAMLLIYCWRRFSIGTKKADRARRQRPSRQSTFRTVALMVLLLLAGLSTYLIIPIRAHADPPLNEGNPSSWEGWRSYVRRDQYAQAPLYPRIWRDRPTDSLYYADWCGNYGRKKGVAMRDCVADNLQFFVTYQLGYMYGRYLLWNFAGRYNDRNGYGSLQNGQFVTGIPPLDRLLVGTGKRPPESLRTASRNVYFLLPLLLGLLGLCSLHGRSRKAFWTVLALFLFAGPALAVYLNMPAYEPRERDYAFVLSFYAFCAWIAFGAYECLAWKPRRKRDGGEKGKELPLALVSLILLAVPALMACQNWDDHDRSGRLFARDYAVNYLNSCDADAILLTYGDNDTFPLWYAQLVEGIRPDVQVVNLSLLATDWYQEQIDRQIRRRGMPGLSLDPEIHTSSYRALMQLVDQCGEHRPVYMSHYAQGEYSHLFRDRLAAVGFVYRLDPHFDDGMPAVDTVDARALAAKVLSDSIHWNSLDKAFVDWTSQRFIDFYWKQVNLAALNLMGAGDSATAIALLDATDAQLPLRLTDSPALPYETAQIYLAAGEEPKASALLDGLRRDLDEQLRYYHSIPKHLQGFIPSTIRPRENIWRELL